MTQYATILWILFCHRNLLFKCDEIETMIYSKSIEYGINKEQSESKPKLTIAFMLPQDILRSRINRQCINKEINKIRLSNWTFTKHFHLDRYVS